MSQHSVADAKNHLSDLIDRTVAGEAVVITRHGHPVVELEAVRPRALPVTPAAHRTDMNASVDAGALVSRMRDEEER